MTEQTSTPQDQPRDNSMIIAGLFLANLTLFPGIAFLILLVWYLMSNERTTKLEAHYFLVGLYGNLAALLLLVVIPLAAILLSHFHESIIMFMIVYFISIHGGFILLATMAVARAINGKTLRGHHLS